MSDHLVNHIIISSSWPLFHPSCHGQMLCSFLKKMLQNWLLSWRHGICKNGQWLFWQCGVIIEVALTVLTEELLFYTKSMSVKLYAKQLSWSSNVWVDQRCNLQFLKFVWWNFFLFFFFFALHYLNMVYMIFILFYCYTVGAAVKINY